MGVGFLRGLPDFVKWSRSRISNSARPRTSCVVTCCMRCNSQSAFRVCCPFSPTASVLYLGHDPCDR
jgi:hypothetical protein